MPPTRTSTEHALASGTPFSCASSANNKESDRSPFSPSSERNSALSQQEGPLHVHSEYGVLSPVQKRFFKEDAPARRPY